MDMFERHEVSTPFRVGSVNAYLAGRTVVDPGPASEEAWSDLLAGLEARDFGPEDVEQVLVTHPHPDHFGLAKRLRDAGARVLASGPAAAIVEDFRGHHAHEKAFFRPFFERHGMARDAAETVTRLPEAFFSFAPDVEVDRTLAAGDKVDVRDTTVTVDSVSGHAEGELVFEYDHDREGERRAVVGDHVLPDITPAPLLLAPPADDGARVGEGSGNGSGTGPRNGSGNGFGDGGRPRVLPSYNRSLSRLAEANYDRLLPGHRAEIADPSGRIAEILDAHEARTERVYELVDGPTTAVEVMEGLFDDLPATEQFHGMSEAVGHLDVLEERGRVERRERGGLVVFRRIE